MIRNYRHHGRYQISSLLLLMVDTACSPIVEVVINTRISRAITLGKRRASIAFASSSKAGSACGFAPGGEGVEEAGDDSESDSDGEDNDDEHGESESESSLKRGLRSPGSETPNEKPYRCTHQDCLKSYTKPSRLAEHLRSHTGEVSFSEIGRLFLQH